MEESVLAPYLPVAILLVFGALLSAVMVFITTLLGPRNPSAIKASPFEAGSDPIGSARERFSVKFYLVAVLFIVFDVEAVFIYPWAVILQEVGWGPMIAMSVFIAILAIGLLYEWKKGALDWT